MNPKRPNLFIIGAMKSGTTYLHYLLAQHPQIFMSPRKEPDYFIKRRPLKLPTGRVFADYGTEERLDAYLSLFQAARDEVYLGESSTAYSKIPRFTHVAPKIAAFTEDPRVIYIMRDPVERAISQYWHAVANHGERRPLLTAVRENKNYRHISNYPRQLKPYIKRFGRDRLYPVTFEELVADTTERLGCLWRWLEIDDSFVPSNLETNKHVRPEIVYRSTSLFDLTRLHRLNKRTIKSRELTHNINRLNKRSHILKKQVNRSDVDSDDAKAYLRSIMLKQTKRLQVALAREFPEWTTLHAAPD